jgi:hypothetical protein
MDTNPVIEDLYSAVEYWSKSWSKGGFEDYLNNTPLGRVLDWGAMPYNQPYGINWSSREDPDEDDKEVEVEEKHYETQEELLRALSNSVVEGILLNPDNMIILADLGEDGDPDRATLIFPDAKGKYFFATTLRHLKKYDESSKGVQASRYFWNSMKRAVMDDTFPTRDWRELYKKWTNWLDDSEDFYGNLSDVFRDFLPFRFDEEEMLNLEDNSLDDFSKVWIVVEKALVLPMMMNWSIQSAQELWNLLRR